MQLKSTKVERAFCYVTSIPHLLLIRWLVRGSLRITNRHNEVMSLSKSIERGPWEARSHTVIEELPRPSWNPKFQYCAHQSSLVVRFLVHMILHHIPTVFFFFKIRLCRHHHHHHHHISVTELGHLLTRSGLTYPQISSKVYHDSFCQLDSSVSLLWVIYFEAFYLHAVSSFSCIPVIRPKIGVIFYSFAICAFVLLSVQVCPAVLLMYFISAAVILLASLEDSF